MRTVLRALANLIAPHVDSNRYFTVEEASRFDKEQVRQVVIVWLRDLCDPSDRLAGTDLTSEELARAFAGKDPNFLPALEAICRHMDENPQLFALLANATRFGRVPPEMLEWSKGEHSFADFTNWLRGERSLPEEPGSWRQVH